ncbi:HIT domain-containing protein [Methylophaga pinxianii]|uniref:HIT domain-containing protein n=1 Tax=Methylophaga pinxianii TaxID=2881052 RepID=UPI001CF54AB7|nr:HIT domain-containing protein [Methylophaga pinxianii]MCB2427926.1 HIT domain-containing protein [Methylophaga pinxianii]UPH44417.1 HIT domain-containing protein [Methylophaga pinxianii]
MKFELHPQLAADTFVVGDLPLCRVLLMNDARFPWLILVPRRIDVSEVYDLAMQDQQLLWQESALVAEKLMKLTQADKMNLAALGNVVPQLHVHHVARFKTDVVWPNPIWGQGKAEPYTDADKQQMLRNLSEMFRGFFVSGQILNV